MFGLEILIKGVAFPTDLTYCSSDPGVGTCCDFSRDLQNLG